MNQIDIKSNYVKRQPENEEPGRKPATEAGFKSAAVPPQPKPASARPEPGRAGVTASPETAARQEASRQDGILKPADARLILRMLGDGPVKFARQDDLVKMHKSLIESMRRLGSGIGDQVAQGAATDREALSARIDGMERAVNGMEAVLRIQLTPEIQSMIDEALARRDRPAAKRRVLRPLGLAVLVLASLAAGAMFSEELGALAAGAETSIRGWTGY